MGKPFNHSELGMVGDNEESKQVNACFDRLWSKYHFKFPANAKTYSRYQPKDKKIISTLHFYFYYILLFQQQHLSKGARIKIIIITMTFVFLFFKLNLFSMHTDIQCVSLFQLSLFIFTIFLCFFC